VRLLSPVLEFRKMRINVVENFRLFHSATFTISAVLLVVIVFGANSQPAVVLASLLPLLRKRLCVL
jgi:hypothetical protein